MKKNAFTIVELIVSLSITLVVMIILYEIIILLKDTFQSSSLKTEILNKESILIDNMYSDFNNNSVSSIIQCGDYCLDFTMTNANTKRLQIDKENLTISYGDYIIKLKDTYSIGNIYFSNDSIASYDNNNNSILAIKIPIYSKVSGNEDLGIKIAFSYNSRQVSIGPIYIVDNTNDCSDNTFCKDSKYNIGDKVKLAGFNWHIIEDNESTITLLLDTSEIPNRSHVTQTMTSYNWSTSYINDYLNNNFYNLLKINGLNLDYIITSKTGICDDKTLSGGNPGSLSTEGTTCNSNYIYSNVRMMSVDEFQKLKNYLTENNINSEFLYSSTAGKWALINGVKDKNNIVQIDENGNTIEDNYSSLLNVRAVIEIRKK
ncbi:MAG: prepilin-type N-terminal cleavage/methylation domain-containing protein [Clostridium sp.]|nr:prepilin-type N-terminal cleavage/methylation domain-containing protein [Clostridium sp.]MCM1444012.1 prepilin-type N-terminal cleavage/methylation domain-containing protein [Candidatus Amulumruptor caecigallinarius]